jgi:hypothetical protein
VQSRITSRHLHAAVPPPLAPHSILALARPYPLRAPRRRLPLSVPLSSCHLVPLLSTHVRSAVVDRALPLRLECPSSYATSTLNPPALGRLLVIEAETPKRCHRSRAAAAESIHDVSLHRSSSGHTYSTPSTARVPGTSTSTSTPALTPFRSATVDSSPPEHAIVESYPR